MIHCSRSSSFVLAPPFPSRPAGCFLDNEFQFSIPVSSGDSVLSLFGPGATGLEAQVVDEVSGPVLQGELSAAEFLAHLELGIGQAAASCIQLEPLEPAGSFQRTGLKSCSVAGGGFGRSVTQRDVEITSPTFTFFFGVSQLQLDSSDMLILKL